MGSKNSKGLCFGVRQKCLFFLLVFIYNLYSKPLAGIITCKRKKLKREVKQVKKIADVSFVKGVIRKYNFSVKKRLGQNFLINPKILDKITDAAEVQPDEVVVEIGPGLGALTQSLANKKGIVLAVEIDQGVIPILTHFMQDYPNVKIVNADILKVNLDQLVDEHFGLTKPYKVVANLPYYITTPIVMYLLESKFKLDSLVIMVQKEVAERMTAPPGKKDYGALSVAVQYYTEASLVTRVPSSSFYPAPEVESAVVKLKLRNKPPVSLYEERCFFQVVKAAFAMRRKTLLNALNSFFADHSKEELQHFLERCSIDPMRRGETLTLDEFACLSNVLWQAKHKDIP